MAKTKDHHLVKRNNVWHFRKVVKGRLIKKALSQSITEARSKRDDLLREIETYGDIRDKKPVNERNPLFGEVAQEWIKIISQEIKLSTLTDYRYSMNRYVLPRFGNTPIKEIGHIAIRKFVAELTCAHKRKNNVLVPMRSVFKMAFMDEIIEKNPMARIRNLKIDKPDIYPLSMEEVRLFLDNVSLRFKNFFTVAFFTGMRFGEMACLKWHNVDFRLGVIKVRETRVMGEEGRPKTKKSTRDIKMLPPVTEALRDQRKETFGKSDYVFLNQYGIPVDPMSTNFHVWKPALKKSGLKPRSMYQTRHTFATLMLDAGEHPGWVQRILGHETMQMIYEKYYSHIRNYERDDGSAFMERVFNSAARRESEDENVSLTS
ncbi:MAG TPA: site-specific integrase [Syntrophales bacterium]|nr:site-specific integrase [Syntrophales bacterium]